jgi:deoxyribonuclease-4
LGGLTVLVENTAGGGGALGSEFEELRAFVQLTGRVPLACCIDTAHLYQSGWDVSTEKGLAATLARLDAAVGLDNIPVIHTNDSRTALGSRADRHEHIGKGGIGLAGFRRILNHPRLRDKAFILETPIDKQGDDLRNLDVARSLVEGTRKAPRNPRTRSND